MNQYVKKEQDYDAADVFRYTSVIREEEYSTSVTYF